MAERKPSPHRPAVDADEKRWRQNVLVASAMPGAYFNATATPLDAYHHDGIITPQQFDDGCRLRSLWERAGQAASVTGSLEPRVSCGGGEEMSDDQAWALGRYRTITRHLDAAIMSILLNVVCWGMGAEAWAAGKGRPGHLGIPMLRVALDALALPPPRRRVGQRA